MTAADLVTAPRRIVFFQMGSWSHTNAALVKALGARLPHTEIIVIDLLERLKRSPRMLALVADLPWLAWQGLRERSLDRNTVLYAPAVARAITALARRLVRELQPVCTIQTTTRFNAATHVPHFTVIDNTVDASRPYLRQLYRASTHSLDWLDDFQRRVFQRSNAVFALGAYVRDSLQSHYGLPADRTFAIGAGPNINLNVRSRITDSKRILFVGTNWERKGGPVLLAAFRSVRARHPDARLSIVGCSPAVDEAGVDVIGRVPRELLHQHFSAARLFALPTVYEPFGIVFVEALHFGLPIVATRLGAVSQMVTHGVNGYTLEPHDVEGVTRALDALLTDDELALTMGVESSRRAAEFTWDRAAALMCERMFGISPNAAAGAPLKRVLSCVAHYSQQQAFRTLLPPCY